MAFTVREAAFQYQTPRTQRVANISFQGDVVRDMLSLSIVAPSPLEVIGLIEDGLPFAEFEDLRAALDVTKGRLADLLGIPKATLQRREAALMLQTDESDRVVRFARLLAQAIELFESLDHARRWLKAPQSGLGHVQPLDFARTEAGAREVSDLLGRIEYGVYS